MCRTHEDDLPLTLRSARWMGVQSFPAPLIESSSVADVLVVAEAASSVERSSATTSGERKQEPSVPELSYGIPLQSARETNTHDV